MVMEETNIKSMKTLKKNVSDDGNIGNSDENGGGGEEVGADDGEMEKKSKTFCCQSVLTFTNSPNLDQSYKKTSKYSSVYDATKRKQIQKGEEEEVHFRR